ncbi:MFS transporter [Alphaproteobacteria bacterium]|nr:MFS transporter [Alphaproteobacteria bacterium]
MLIALAGLITMISMGVRLTNGLFLHPVVAATHLQIVEISFAFAVGQLMWGAFQPVFGILSDRRGPFFALALGGILLAVGNIAAIWSDTMFWLIVSFGLLAPAGAAASSFGVVMAAISPRLPPSLKNLSGGVVNACGSAGQFLFSPLNQFFITCWGYGSALMMMGLASLAIIPAAFGIDRGNTFHKTASTREQSVKAALLIAAKNPSYLLLQVGFFTCGFHIAFLVTHLPGEISSCGHAAAVAGASLGLIGFCNIIGSLTTAWLGSFFKMKYILTVLYASRAVMIGLFLLSARSEWDFYLFSAGMGLTWTSTVAPTASIVGKLFGLRYLATLFGTTFLTHRIGGFLGALLGGMVVSSMGNYQWMWYADMTMALIAALAHLPIREDAPIREKSPA